MINIDHVLKLFLIKKNCLKVLNRIHIYCKKQNVLNSRFKRTNNQVYNQMFDKRSNLPFVYDF